MNHQLWTEEKLQQLVASQAEETSQLGFEDFGRAGSSWRQKLSLAITVAAFANSSGGTIICGIAKKHNRAWQLSPADGNKISAEHLDALINSKIRPQTPQLEIAGVQLSGRIETTVFIIQVPEGNRGPHLVNGLLYKRQGMETVLIKHGEQKKSSKRNQKLIFENKPFHVEIKNASSWQTDEFLLLGAGYHLKNKGTFTVFNCRMSCELENFKELNWQFRSRKHLTVLEKDRNIYVFLKKSFKLYPDQDNEVLYFTFKIPAEHFNIVTHLAFKVTLYTDYGNYSFTNAAALLISTLIDLTLKKALPV